ncbi:MAG: hypothetical protein M1828_003078 [Chrysothrix sp. TS-e1954]|nr:MAG: hypothetical protein M1828_003078 [Chrysothrix sp. TS-e1954]
MALLDKPVIVFSPGAWHPASAYNGFFKALESAGYPTPKAITYPSLTSKEPEKTTCAEDAECVRHEIMPLVEEGKDVIVLMHSYGAQPGSAGAHGLSKKARMREGKHGGVLGLIVFSGFIINEGLSCAGSMGGALPPWVKMDHPSAGYSYPDDPVKMFCAGCDPEGAKQMTSHVTAHAWPAFFSPQPANAWAEADFQGCFAYIVLTEDIALPKIGQETMLQYSGQSWEIEELQASHNAPFLDQTQKSLDLIERLVGKFRRVVAE